jgi:putative SOS response-associated peptidase YedK
VCGRFTLTSTPETLAERFELESPPAVSPRYNIAPGQDVLAIRAVASGIREAVALRWGLVPSWADDPAIGNRMINARAETLTSKPAFRDAVRRRRCLIAADGFYEWADHGGPKQAYHIHRDDHAPFAFAGLWEHWRDGAGRDLQTCTIVTTDAAPVIASIHPRMPVMLEASAWSAWLDPTGTDPTPLLPLLHPIEDERLAFHPVGDRVNHIRNDDAACLTRVPEGPRQESLFT